MDSKGDVFTSGEDGAFFRYLPDAGSIEKFNVDVPSEPGREGYNRMEVWSSDVSGMLYGGSSDGYLFGLNPIR